MHSLEKKQTIRVIEAQGVRFFGSLKTSAKESTELILDVKVDSENTLCQPEDSRESQSVLVKAELDYDKQESAQEPHKALTITDEQGKVTEDKILFKFDCKDPEERCAKTCSLQADDGTHWWLAFRRGGSNGDTLVVLEQAKG